MIGIFPGPMPYAGPRDVIYQAKSRRNAGAAFFITGRDPSGIKRSDDGEDTCTALMGYGPSLLSLFPPWVVAVAAVVVSPSLPPAPQFFGDALTSPHFLLFAGSRQGHRRQVCALPVSGAQRHGNPDLPEDLLRQDHRGLYLLRQVARRRLHQVPTVACVLASLLAWVCFVTLAVFDLCSDLFSFAVAPATAPPVQANEMAVA